MSRSLSLVIVSLLAASVAMPSQAATSSPAFDDILFTYHGGRLIQRVQVATLFWGLAWKTSALPAFFNRFFAALFADGRYLENLTQYSAGGYSIRNGELAGTTIDPRAVLGIVTDEQIQVEIESQIAAGHLPQPGEDTLYVVFTPPHTVVEADDLDSERDFTAYHDFVFDDSISGDGFAYAVIPYDDTLTDPTFMTTYASTMLAAVITDPEPYAGKLGWYDDNLGEIENIPEALAAMGQLKTTDLCDKLEAPDGSVYLVERVWSNCDRAPVAFGAHP